MYYSQYGILTCLVHKRTTVTNELSEAHNSDKKAREVFIEVSTGVFCSGHALYDLPNMVLFALNLPTFGLVHILLELGPAIVERGLNIELYAHREVELHRQYLH